MPRPRAFCIMSLRVTVVGEVKSQETRSRSESESEKGDLVGSSRRETLRSTHDQDEGEVELTGGPHQFPLKRIWMSCG